MPATCRRASAGRAWAEADPCRGGRRRDLRLHGRAPPAFDRFRAHLEPLLAPHRLNEAKLAHQNTLRREGQLEARHGERPRVLPLRGRPSRAGADLPGRRGEGRPLRQGRRSAARRLRRAARRLRPPEGALSRAVVAGRALPAARGPGVADDGRQAGGEEADDRRRRAGRRLAALGDRAALVLPFDRRHDRLFQRHADRRRTRRSSPASGWSTRTRSRASTTTSSG